MNCHPNAHFTTDWVTTHLKEWDACFAELSGKPCRILEVGSYEGRSACWFLHNVMSDPKSELICVDPWAGPDGATRLRRFDMNVSLSGRSNQVSRHKARILDIQHTLPTNFDLIYVDGDHVAKEVLSQAAALWSKLKPGGLMLFDDYLWTDPKVLNPPKAGIDAFLDLWQHDLIVVHKTYQVLVQKL